MAEKQFRKTIEEIVESPDSVIPKNEIIEGIFKTSVAKLLQTSMEHGKGESGDRLEMDALTLAKEELIREFRGASLGVHQRSIEDYEKLFASTLEEIFNHASHAHEGEDSVKYANKNLEINKDAYVNEGGLFVPPHLAKR